MKDKQLDRLRTREKREEERPDETSVVSGDVSGSERRRYRRIPVELGLTVTLAEKPVRALATVESTTTINVSPGDVFFLSANHDRLKVDSEVLLSIDLPAGSTNLFTAKHLQVKARVTRFADLDREDPGKRGVAARFLRTPRFTSELE